MQTIAALSTAQNTSGAIAVVRISGETALDTARQVFSSKDKRAFEPRYACVGNLILDGIKEKAVCIYFKAPLSYTGEDVCELQFHGGTAVTRAVLHGVFTHGATPAKPGEFTMRAFFNGKLSLTEAEGIADIINAQSDTGAKRANALAGGKIHKTLEDIKQNLYGAKAQLEVILDYGEDFNAEMRDPSLLKISESLKTLKALLPKTDSGKCYDEVPKAVIIGSPNAGKSSLLNALLKDNRAIVTAVPGTTRDVLRDNLKIGDITVALSDTAGIRNSTDEIETQGIKRAQSELKSADLILLIFDLSVKLSEDFSELYNTVSAQNVLLVGNKSDAEITQNLPFALDIKVSAKSGDGIENLEKLIYSRLKTVSEAGGAFTRERQVIAAKAAYATLADIIEKAEFYTTDIICALLNTALARLAELSGENASDEVITAVFASFCIGK
ncbi:MAG: tRNA uridine-5-carboxymethylaminomethyl(34) synthesis GTPase MnmE [Christensenellaceae bacterium]|jgi:tRNA modification GTPase|nr:tRNA uridine-5-carboxymethylaminomethyl(34) synthesis GTPase MnmE [Christensenellaceae bacterium]